MRTRSAPAATALALGLFVVGCDANGRLDPALLVSDTTVVARDIAFEPTTITVPAGRPFTMTLDNADDGVPHGLQVTQAGAALASADIIIGPGTVALEVPPLGAGRYEFSCPVHPNMAGTIVATP